MIQLIAKTNGKHYNQRVSAERGKCHIWYNHTGGKNRSLILEWTDFFSFFKYTGNQTDWSNMTSFKKLPWWTAWKGHGGQVLLTVLLGTLPTDFGVLQMGLTKQSLGATVKKQSWLRKSGNRAGWCDYFAGSQCSFCDSKGTFIITV